MQVKKIRTKPRVVILLTHPIQYFVELFRHLDELDNIDLLVLYRTRLGLDSYFDEQFSKHVQWDIPLLGGYRHIFLSEKNQIRGLELNIMSEIIKNRPDVVIIHGYNSWTNLLALLASKFIGAKALLRGDTRIFDRHKQHVLRGALKRLLFRCFDGFIAIGRKNHEYYEAMGAHSSQIYLAPFSVDNSLFSSGRDRDGIREFGRKKLGMPLGAKVILFVGKLTAQKRVADLIEALKDIANADADVQLVIVGSGAEEATIREKVIEYELDDHVHFLGFKNQSEMANILAIADVFALPAEDESWGLVVNEAMAAGLPVVLSDGVGAATDLVEGKETGLIYPVGDIKSLVSALETILRSDDKRASMMRCAHETIQGWTISASAQGIVSAVGATLGRTS